MLAPGATFTGAGRVLCTIGAGVVPDFINEGIGFKNDGSVCIDTNAPGVIAADGGIALSPVGAIYGKTVQDPSDVWVSGIRLSTLGQLLYEQADPVSFNNGNPVTATGNFSVS